jgi:hypothetical protein
MNIMPMFRGHFSPVKMGQTQPALTTGTKRWTGMTSITTLVAAASTACFVILIR